MSTSVREFFFRGRWLPREGAVLETEAPRSWRRYSICAAEKRRAANLWVVLMRSVCRQGNLLSLCGAAVVMWRLPASGARSSCQEPPLRGSLRSALTGRS